MSKTEYRTPPARAKELGVACEKIIAAINSGELRAINTSGGKRARWKISDEDWQAWLATRSNQKPVKETSRKSKRSEVIEFYQ